MFSNLASYIFGGADQPESSSQEKRSDVPNNPQNEDEWVVVGGDVQPSLTLGSLSEAAPRPSTGSTGSSEAPSEVSGGNNVEDPEDDIVIVNDEPMESDGGSTTASAREVALTRSGRRLTSPLACANAVTLPQMKALRAAQKAKQKDTGRHNTAKANERINKAVKIRSNQHNKRNKSANLAIKASGCSKQLKQC